MLVSNYTARIGCSLVPTHRSSNCRAHLRSPLESSRAACQTTHSSNHSFLWGFCLCQNHLAWGRNLRCSTVCWTAWGLHARCPSHESLRELGIFRLTFSRFLAHLATNCSCGVSDQPNRPFHSTPWQCTSCFGSRPALYAHRYAYV